MAADETTVSWISATGYAVGLAKNAAEARHQINALEDAKDSLSQLVAEFRELSNGAAVVRPFGWEGRSPSPELARDLTEAATTLGSRPLNRIVSHIERFTAEVRAALVDCWGKHVAEQIGDVGELLVLAQTLSAVEGTGSLSQQLQTTLRELASIQRAVPSEKAVGLLEEAGETLRTLEESLQPESVRRFLSAVGRGGSSIKLLSKDVIDWLTSHNALDSFKIVAGSPVDETDV